MINIRIKLLSIIELPATERAREAINQGKCSSSFSQQGFCRMYLGLGSASPSHMTLQPRLRRPSSGTCGEPSGHQAQADAAPGQRRRRVSLSCGVCRRVRRRVACVCLDVLGRLCDLGCDVAHKKRSCVRSLGYIYGLNLVGTWPIGGKSLERCKSVAVAGKVPRLKKQKLIFQKEKLEIFIKK